MIKLERPTEHNRRPLHVTIGGDRYRFVYSRDDGNGFRPHVLVFRTGPNGSPAGTGPKGFHRIFRPLQPSYSKGQWLGTLTINLPHLSWARMYRMRFPRTIRGMIDRAQRKLYP